MVNERWSRWTNETLGRSPPPASSPLTSRAGHSRISSRVASPTRFVPCTTSRFLAFSFPTLYVAGCVRLGDVGTLRYPSYGTSRGRSNRSRNGTCRGLSRYGLAQQPFPLFLLCTWRFILRNRRRGMGSYGRNGLNDQNLGFQSTNPFLKTIPYIIHFSTYAKCSLASYSSDGIGLFGIG